MTALTQDPRAFALILEGIADGITVQDRDGRVVYANSAAARQSGYASVESFLSASPGEVVEQFDLFDQDGVAFDLSKLPGRRVMRGEPDCVAVIYARHRTTGQERWSLVRGSGVRDDKGHAQFAVNIWHDVSEDHRRERHEAYLARATTALSESLDYERMLATLAGLLVPGLADWCAIHLREGDEMVPVSVAHVDPNKVRSAHEVNKKYPPHPNHPRGVWNVARTGIAELYPDIPDILLSQIAKDETHLQILRDTGMKSVIIVPIRARDRVLGTITLVSSEGLRRYDRHDLQLAEELGRRAGSSIENVRLYAAEKSARDQAEEANRVKDEFLATVSHELRTPLNAILGWASLLKGRGHEAVSGKALDVIHRNALAQSKIIDDILDVSRIITGKLLLDLKPCDLAAIVVDAIEVTRPSAQAKDITVEFAAVFGASILVADAARLQQVIWNLLSNAVKFSSAGGVIRIEVTRAADALTLTVMDTGKGIEADFLPFVFDRFKQADGSMTRRVGGLGLGLAIVRHIVELHGGSVEVESEGLDRGTLFRVTLPVRALAQASAQVAEPATPVANSATTGLLAGVRVLVVDDDPDARELLQAILLGADALVATAASAAQGFLALTRFRPHVLVSDIAMPDEDGYAFIQRIRQLPYAAGGGIPSIALTAYTSAHDKTRALAMGFSSHLGKPVEPADLIAGVANLAVLVLGRER